MSALFCGCQGRHGLANLVFRQVRQIMACAQGWLSWLATYIKKNIWQYYLAIVTCDRTYEHASSD